VRRIGGEPTLCVTVGFFTSFALGRYIFADYPAAQANGAGNFNFQNGSGQVFSLPRLDRFHGQSRFSTGESPMVVYTCNY